MKANTAECLNCGHKFIPAEINSDELGHNTTCPKCGSSFDIMEKLDPNIITGTFDIKPNDFMEKEFQKSIDKAGSVGLHLVHIFFIGPITKELEVRKAYFDTFGEAGLYAWQYERDHKDKKNDEQATYIIYINRELKYAHFKGRYADDFMGLQKKSISSNKEQTR